MDNKKHTLQLNVTHELPQGFLECDARDLARILKGPTLIHLSGRNPQPLFVCVLLHGNETTGFQALQQVLQEHHATGLPRAMSIFVGNVAAAERNVRMLRDQMDFNRVWPRTPFYDRPEAALMRQVYDAMVARKPFASIDLHNNSGINPFYGCVAKLEQPFLYLAQLFSRVAVYIERPLGVQSIAMADLCPAVTVECGRIGSKEGMVHAAEFIRACLHLSHFPEHPIGPHELELLHTVAVVKVPPSVSISFDHSEADIRFRQDIDHFNFSPMAAGTSIGTTSLIGAARLQVLSGDGAHSDVEWFRYVAGEICLTRSAIPAMLTRDPEAVHADCLCYLMEPFVKA